jgi:hypothetical protein
MLRRTFSIVLIAAAVVWGAIVARLAREYGDGPPMGALCSAIPAFVLLIVGGALWPKNKNGI